MNPIISSRSGLKKMESGSLWRSRRSSQQASGSTESPRGSTAPARSEAAITVAGAETGEPSADWEATDPNSTAHFVRAVADLAARSVHLLDPFRLRSRNGVRRHPPSLTYDSASDLDMKIHANLDRLTHFVEVCRFLSYFYSKSRSNDRFLRHSVSYTGSKNDNKLHNFGILHFLSLKSFNFSFLVKGLNQ